MSTDCNSDRGHGLPPGPAAVTSHCAMPAIPVPDQSCHSDAGVAGTASLAFDKLERIAVFRALQLGDLLCVVPALRALRAAAPRARITLIGLPWAEVFAARFCAYIDDFLEFPGFPGLPEQAPALDRLPGFFTAAQAMRFDLALQLHGSGTLSNPLTVALGAACNAGYFEPGQYCPDPRRYLQWIGREQEVLRYLRLLRVLGVQAAPEYPPESKHRWLRTPGNREPTVLMMARAKPGSARPSQPDTGAQPELPLTHAALEFPLQENDFRELEAAFRGIGHCWPPGGAYICLHAGARLPSRRWPPRHFAEVACALMADGWTVVMTGSAAEREVIDAVLRHLAILTERRPIDLGGRTTLGALAALIRDASLLVCNDTGVSHIAAAVKTRSVIVCSGADPLRWAPLDSQRHRMLYAAVSCRPCNHTVCPIGHPCAEGLSAELALREARQACGPPPVAPLAGDKMARPGLRRPAIPDPPPQPLDEVSRAVHGSPGTDASAGMANLRRNKR
jgi:ADP-heptose:LPS heptosyltransferase